jgi:carbon-monoxide dehydrogenase small subunit
MIIQLDVNGEQRTATVAGSESLLTTLREELALPGAKNACEQGECGSCSVLLDDTLVCSCLVMAADCDGTTVRTIEGVAADGVLTAVQQAMHAAGAVQCGFCTPGIVIAASDLFAQDPHPSPDTIREALAGNICRCTGYGAIMRALEQVAGGSSCQRHPPSAGYGAASASPSFAPTACPSSPATSPTPPISSTTR